MGMAALRDINPYRRDGVPDTSSSTVIKRNNTARPSDLNDTFSNAQQPG